MKKTRTKPSLHTVKHLLHPQGSNNHRAKILHPEWNLILAVLAVISVVLLSLMSKVYVQSGGFILGYATNITANQVVEQTNGERASSGLTALRMDEVLNRAAFAKANDMFANQYWAHVSPTGKQPWDFIHESGYSYSAAGENLARDFYETPDMVKAWMDSPTHKANIINQKYTHIGVAVVNGTLNGTETTLVVQMFGSPLANAPTATITDEGVASPQNARAITEESPEERAIRAQQNTRGIDTLDEGAIPVQRSTTISQGTQNETLTAAPQSQVLAAFTFLTGTLRPWPSISPIQFVKALTVVLLATVGSVLLYDWALLTVSPRSRLVGHNLAHILFLATVAVLIMTFQSGLIQ